MKGVFPTELAVFFLLNLILLFPLIPCSRVIPPFTLYTMKRYYISHPPIFRLSRLFGLSGSFGLSRLSGLYNF